MLFCTDNLILSVQICEESDMDKTLEKYYDIYKRMKDFDENKIPLCAAETHISNFCRMPLISDFEGKYSFSSSGRNSFIGGEFVEELKELISQECKILFDAEYTNAESLTGINCFTVCAMSLLQSGDHVLLTTPEQGGHASMPIILNTLGVTYETMPYDFDKYQIDYAKINMRVARGDIKYLIFCQSDVIYPPLLHNINLPEHVGIIYDGTQTLGLISGSVLPNPLKKENVVLIGGTHKTLPAPSCGLIMTNNKEYWCKLSNNITPNYLRNIQPNHMAALLLGLVEQRLVGCDYQKKVVSLGNQLGKALECKGFKVAQIKNNDYTFTHQIFLLMSPSETSDFFINAMKYNITLNDKHKLLFKNDGIRLGTQQIARYDWNSTEINTLAELLRLIKDEPINSNKIIELRRQLITKKIPHFEYQNITII